MRGLWTPTANLGARKEYKTSTLFPEAADGPVSLHGGAGTYHSHGTYTKMEEMGDESKFSSSQQVGGYKVGAAVSICFLFCPSASGACSGLWAVCGFGARRFV